jgi:hypothetical protein
MCQCLGYVHGPRASNRIHRWGEPLERVRVSLNEPRNALGALLSNAIRAEIQMLKVNMLLGQDQGVPLCRNTVIE